MLIQEAFEAHEKLVHVTLITTRVGRFYIIDDHMADLLHPMGLLEQGFGECGCHNRRHMFVLGDGQHLGFGQATQRNAVLESDHWPTFHLTECAALAPITTATLARPSLCLGRVFDLDLLCLPLHLRRLWQGQRENAILEFRRNLGRIDAEWQAHGANI